MLYLLLLLTLLSITRSDMIPQCTCEEFDTCKNSTVKSFISCADQCKKHITHLGARYSEFRQCLLSREPLFNAMAECQSNKLAGACAENEGQMVPRRYPETMKLAAFSEINSMLSRSGVQNEARKFMSTGKKFVTCIMKCSERGGGSCMKKLNCGLKLPSDNEVVRITKQCAIDGGFNAEALQKLCTCIANSGLRSLAPLCPRIQIS